MSLRKTFEALGVGALLIALLCLSSTGFAGDSVYGTVTAVRPADLVVTFDYGAGTYEVRLAGIDNPRDSEMAEQAAAFVSQRLVRKNCRLRFENRTPDGQVIGRLFTDDPDYGITDIGVELVRAGLVTRQGDYEGYKYGELEEAEKQAKDGRNGIWKSAPK